MIHPYEKSANPEITNEAMKKIFITMIAFALTIAAQAQKDTIGVSNFTAIYRYECKTTDADGQPVTDSMYIAVQTSGGITKSFPLRRV